MSNTALLVIDVQQSFEQMPFWTEQDLAAYQSAQNNLIAHARNQSWPVIFVYHVSRGPFSLASGFVEPMAWVDRLPGDPVFHKRVHNALSESGLEPWLVQRGISRLLISGLRTEQCCETTARVASDAGYEVEYVMDATHTFDMQLPNGEVSSVAQIKAHTEMVLAGRFAAVVSVDHIRARATDASLNCRCPRSGKPVSADALTDYRGFQVGFCNTGCRDGFAADPAASAFDCLYFDRLISRQSTSRAYASS